MEKALNRGVRDSLVRTARLLRDDADLLEELAERAEHDAIELDADQVLLRVDALRGLPEAIGRRVIRRALFSQRVVAGFPHVESVLGLIHARPGKQIALPGALLARREKGYVRLSRPSPA
jgi:tRNA(Ile)-lysidine synthase